jgi:hypothetical protein
MANQRMIVTIDFIPLPFILANLLKKKKNEKKNLPPPPLLYSRKWSVLCWHGRTKQLSRSQVTQTTWGRHSNSLQLFNPFSFFLSFPFRNETHTRHSQTDTFWRKKNSPWDSVALIATSWRNNFSRQTRNRRPKYKNFFFKRDAHAHSHVCVRAYLLVSLPSDSRCLTIVLRNWHEETPTCFVLFFQF